jgi:transposase
MISVDQFMDVKTRIANNQSLRSIAKDTGHSRNTIRKIARSEHCLQNRTEKKPRKQRAHKIDPFGDYIKERVSKFDFSAERILPEIRTMGYVGGVHSLRRFIASIKAESKRLASATVRFETPPGKQAQCDWGHVGKFLNAAGDLIDIYVFVIVLSYSRQMFIRFTTSMKIPIFIECHAKAFEYFQGVPQTILYDNMAQVRSGPNKLNSTFADFSGHFGFTVATHRPYLLADTVPRSKSHRRY